MFGLLQISLISMQYFMVIPHVTSFEIVYWRLLWRLLWRDVVKFSGEIFERFKDYLTLIQIKKDSFLDI